MLWIKKRSLRSYLTTKLHKAPALEEDVLDPAYSDLDLRIGYRSQISSKITGETGEVIGTIIVYKSLPATFSKDEESVLNSLGRQSANVIATVIQNTQLGNARLHELNTNLQTLSAAMVG